MGEQEEGQRGEQGPSPTGEQGEGEGERPHTPHKQGARGDQEAQEGGPGRGGPKRLTEARGGPAGAPPSLARVGAWVQALTLTRRVLRATSLGSVLPVRGPVVASLTEGVPEDDPRLLC